MASVGFSNSINQSNIVVLEGSKAENSGIFGSLGKGQRVFISGVNSLVGHSLFEELRNDHIAIHTGETPHKFFGTVNAREAESVPVPSGSIKILNCKSKPRTFRKQVARCNLFILDLMANGCDLEEAEYIIKSLKQPSEELKDKAPAE